MGFLVRELGKEVFIDAAEDVAGDPLQLVGVEGPQQLAEDVVVEFLVFALGQDAAQALVVRLDGLHRRDDGLGSIRSVGQGHQVVEPCLGFEEDGTLPGEIFFGDGSPLAAAEGQLRFNFVFYCQVAAVGVAQEDQPHHRQEVLVAGIVGVGAQSVGCAPETPLNGFDVFELGQE